MRKIRKIQVEKIGLVNVDYSKKLSEMISLGNFTMIDREINDKNFPIVGTGQCCIKLELIDMNGPSDTEMVLTTLSDYELKPAPLELLLAFVANIQNIDNEFFIIAFASSYTDNDGTVFFPSINQFCGDRELEKCWLPDDRCWGSHVRFLAFNLCENEK